MEIKPELHSRRRSCYNCKDDLTEHIAANQIELTEHFDLFLFIVVSSLSLCPVYIYVAALRFQLENFVTNSVL